jgi:hypothetical protein
MMTLLKLPNEILMQIVDYLQTQREINAVTHINRRFHSVFNDFLYRENIRSGSSALFWAANRGQESTARTIVHLGADINMPLQEPVSHPGETIRYSTAIHIAAKKGHLAVVKVLVDAGANLEARDHRGWTPLFVALASGHEKIARTIGWNLDDAACTCIVESADGLKPLHVAARLGLSKSVQYFVDRGTDVDTKDLRGKTALHHALLGSLRYRGNIDVPIPSKNDLFKTVLLLLDLGANPELEITATKNSITTTRTARQIGMHYPDERIRGLFGGRVVHRLIPLSPSQIGRTWMSSSSPAIRYETISVTQPLMRQQAIAPKTESELFPVLGTPRAPDLQAPPPDSPWSQSNVDHLITRLSVNDAPEVPASARPEPADPFPQLSTLNQDHPMKTAASDMWANLGKLEPQSSGRTKNSSVACSSGEKNDPAAESKRKARGKGRWKPLAL